MFSRLIAFLGSRPSARRLLAWMVLSTAALGSFGAYSDAPPQEVDARDVIANLSNSLAQGRDELMGHLARLGFDANVDPLGRSVGNQLEGFSSSTVVESLYRRAEAQSAGEGDRFLAVLYHGLASNSAAAAADPDFTSLRHFAPADLDLRVHPILFVPPQAIADVSVRADLPPTLDRAIGKLAQAYSGSGLADARVMLLRRLRKPGFDERAFDRSLAETTSNKDALRLIIERGTPPPRAENALRDIMGDMMAHSAAFSVDNEALSIMNDLSDGLPPDLQHYAAAEGQLPSRKRQIHAAAQLHQTGASKPSDTQDILAMIDRPQDWPPPSAPPMPSGPGPGPIAPPPSRLGEAYDTYVSRTLASPEHPEFTPRIFEVARFSARAGRGISVGAKVRSTIEATPLSAVWLPNRNDDRFGRLFVQFAVPPGAPPLIGASRPMFADSFYSARSAAWGQYGKEATYRDGDILILMSMDPQGKLTERASQASGELISRALAGLLSPEQQQDLESKAQQLDALREAAGQDNNVQAQVQYLHLQEQIEEVIESSLAKLSPAQRSSLQARAGQLDRTRGIVIHPALVGREMGWTVARVDFWFNQIGLLLKESQTMNGGSPVPASLRDISLQGAETWQFYEKNAVIALGEPDGQARRLMVISPSDDPGAVPGSGSTRSHFAISMFGHDAPEGAPAVEDGLFRLVAMEKQLQPLLDWLAVNHHDFMRLNDLSESFSLLRWLKTQNVPMTVVDMGGEGRAIATPDRVDLAHGPSTGARQ